MCRSTTSSGLYDMDTVCLLQAMDVFGPMYLPPGTYVEAVTDMKLYCLTRADYDTLPPLTVKVGVHEQSTYTPCPACASVLHHGHAG